MINQSNVTHFIVGKDDDLATTSETRDDLIAGQIGIFLVGSDTAIGTGAADLAAGNRFSICYRDAGGYLRETPVIEYNNITAKNAESTPAVETQKSVALGFTGTTGVGSIAVTNSEDYVFHYVLDDGTKSTGRGKLTKVVAYKSSTSATQVEIAAGLAANVIKNNVRENPALIVPKVLIDNAGAVITGTGNLTAVNGGLYVTAATDVDAVVSVGDYIRLGTVAGAALTDDAYRVVALDTTNEIITLDRPFQGTSATYTEANCDYIAAVTAGSANAGLLLVAQELSYEPGIKKYAQLNIEFWKIGEGFGATTSSVVSTASKGIGTYKEIAEIEWFLRGNRGEPWRVGNYPKTYTPDAVLGKTYQQIVFSYEDTNATTIDRTVKSFGEVYIATENESASTVHTDLKDILNIA